MSIFQKSKKLSHKKNINILHFEKSGLLNHFLGFLYKIMPHHPLNRSFKYLIFLLKEGNIFNNSN